MKWARLILLLVLLTTGCAQEVEQPAVLDEDEVSSGRVRITFSCTMPESGPTTKALGETSGLQTMHLAVFGSSGHYKEYVKAEQLEHSEAERVFRDKDGQEFTKQVDVYTFSATLQLSNTARTIHFIGNGPASITIGDAKDVLPALLCNDPQDASPKETAFWQMISLPEIKAATDGTGNFLNPAGEIRQAGEDYMVDDETRSYFNNIPLVRNWAKIVLRNNWRGEWEEGDTPPELPDWPKSNFKPISFAVVNVPSRGAIVPYGGKKGFIPNYQTLAFDSLYVSTGSYAYKGNLPEGTAFDNYVPEPSDFENFKGRVQKYNALYDPQYNIELSDQLDNEPAVYLYERPAPGENTEASYVIIYGTYKNPDDPSLSEEEKVTGVNCYYKVDLMADGEYYPILRNFKYQIQIRKITSRGYDDPLSAAESAGSADVSSDVSASHLSDISDGTRRMAIQPWMSQTFFKGDPEYDGDPAAEELPEHLYVKFYDDISNPEDPVINMKKNEVGKMYVYAEFPDGSGVIKDNRVVIDDPKESGDDYGWRTIRFRINQPDLVVSRTQTLRICCKSDPSSSEESPLYRDIVLTLQPLQPLQASCVNPRVLRKPGQPQQLNISIPDGLVESMFPLVFIVEPQEMSLTPDNSEVKLPVIYGKSINPLVAEADKKPRFQFERTVTWEDYRNTRTSFVFNDESRWKVFPCYFFTNCAHSATDIWVYNKYFNSTGESACASFTDYSSFDAAFTAGIPREIGKDVPVQLAVESENGTYRPVYVQLEGLSWPGHELAAGKDYYVFTPMQENNTLTFQTANTDGDISVYLFSEDDYYEPATLVPWRFANPGFVSTHALHSNWTGQYGSNVVYDLVNSDGGKNLLFSFTTDSRKPKPKVYLSNKVNVTGADEINLTTFNRSTSPYYGNENYYWANLQSKAGTDPVSMTLGAPGYVEEPITANRFTGNILSSRADASTLKTWFQNASYKQGVSMGSNPERCKMFIGINPQPEVTSEGLVFKAKETYTLTVRFYSKVISGVEQPTNCEIVNVQLEYKMSDGVAQDHRSYEIVKPEESSFYLYPGHGSEYIWSFPQGQQEGSITFTAPNGRDAVVSVLRVWGFYNSASN